MAGLADTNVILRWAQPQDPLYAVAVDSVAALRSREITIHIAPQNVYEFWNVATRPADKNGFRLSPSQADKEVRRIEAFFPLLEDTPAVYAEWRRLVVAENVSGVQVHDARLAALMRVHGITDLLTFNARDFSRYGLNVLLPQDVVSSAPQIP